jgi:hypothetical protein
MEEKITNGVQEAWKERLVRERFDLMQKAIRLKKIMEDPNEAMSKKEWDMISRQYYVMSDYIQILTDRCAYYGLIESCDLGIHYPNGTVKG